MNGPVRRWILIAVVAVLVGLGAVYVPRGVAFLHIGTTFAAQQVCACLHVSARPLDSCRNELGKAGGLLSVETQGDTVKASALLGLFSGESRNEAPYGCHPVR
jgi:hypothetical protein